MMTRAPSWRRPPRSTSDVAVSSQRTCTIGVCLDCGALVRLAVNLDCAELMLAHELPHCAAWDRDGMLAIGKSSLDVATTPPHVVTLPGVCRGCGLHDCIGCEAHPDVP